MATLVEFTTFDDIRAALGVSEDELLDATLSLAVYEQNLGLKLDKLNENLVDAYLEAKGKDSPTKQEARLVRAVSLFATYVVALHLTASLAMFSPKEISDGKAHLTRFTNDPYQDTAKRVAAQHDEYREEAAAAYAALVSATTVATMRPYMRVASGSVDPVTGS
jgi:hypothetical protein